MDEVKFLAVLHDHHKDTFAGIRARERERDRQFVLLVVGLALLAVQVAYPVQFGGAVEAITVGGLTVAIGSLPAAVVLTATWVLLALVALRYGQRVVLVEQQYEYLHALERRLSRWSGSEGLFKRESDAYLENAPPFQDWAWILYVLVFPIVGLFAVIATLLTEIIYLQYPLHHKILDTLMALSIIVSLYLYRLHPPRRCVDRLRRAFGR